MTDTKAEELKVGDCVRLNSGSVRLTVVSIDGDEVACTGAYILGLSLVKLPRSCWTKVEAMPEAAA